MKVTVDPSRCEGNARCIGVAPGVFELGDDDQAHVRAEEVGEGLRPLMEQAARLCPRQAISLEGQKAQS